MTVTVACVGGTGESFAGDKRTEPVGMLSYATRHLDPERFTGRWVPYRSSFGLPADPAPEVASMAEGKSALAAIVDAAPGRVAILGYSQGSQIARQYLADKPNPKVVAAGLIADPYRPHGIQEGPELDGSGLAGTVALWPKTVRVFEMAAPNDVICNAPLDSPWRDVADSLQFFSVTNPQEWVDGMIKLCEQHGWQTPLGRPLSLEQIEQATAGLNGYLGIGGPSTHTQYDWAMFPGTNKTYCQVLAERINALDVP